LRLDPPFNIVKLLLEPGASVHHTSLEGKKSGGVVNVYSGNEEVLGIHPEHGF
jgi:hypothetical protein